MAFCRIQSCTLLLLPSTMSLNLDVDRLTVVSTDGSYFGASTAYLVDLSTMLDDEVTDFQDGTDRDRSDFAVTRGIPLADVLNGEEPPFVSKFVLYRSEFSSGDSEGYNYLIPVDTGNYWMIDCWIVNEKGEKHPGYNIAPVPVTTSNLEPVGDSPWITD